MEKVPSFYCADVPDYQKTPCLHTRAVKQIQIQVGYARFIAAFKNVDTMIHYGFEMLQLFPYQV